MEVKPLVDFRKMLRELPVPITYAVRHIPLWAVWIKFSDTPRFLKPALKWPGGSGIGFALGPRRSSSSPSREDLWDHNILVLITRGFRHLRHRLKLFHMHVHVGPSNELASRPIRELERMHLTHARFVFIES